VDPLEWASFHSVQGGEMAGLRQNVGKGRRREGLAEAIIIMNFTTTLQLHNTKVPNLAALPFHKRTISPHIVVFESTLSSNDAREPFQELVADLQGYPRL
jgi:hypothetical protein